MINLNDYQDKVVECVRRICQRYYNSSEISMNNYSGTVASSFFVKNALLPYNRCKISSFHVSIDRTVLSIYLRFKLGDKFNYKTESIFRLVNCFNVKSSAFHVATIETINSLVSGGIQNELIISYTSYAGYEVSSINEALNIIEEDMSGLSTNKELCDIIKLILDTAK